MSLRPLNSVQMLCPQYIYIYIYKEREREKERERGRERSSRPEVFCTKGVLKNFAKFTRKHLCQGLFFNKVADLRPATLLKKRLWHRRFPVDFEKNLRTPFFTEHLQWLLYIYIYIFRCIAKMLFSIHIYIYLKHYLYVKQFFF